MMKLFLIYLFSVSITLQSLMGPFVCYYYSNKASEVSICNQSIHKIESDRPYSAASNYECYSQNLYSKFIDKIITQDLELPKFVRDTVVEHLFSPSNCPEAGITFLFISYHIVGHCFDLLSIEEKINHHVHSYSSYFRNIKIGLPITKIIFPYHNFY